MSTPSPWERAKAAAAAEYAPNAPRTETSHEERRDETAHATAEAADGGADASPDHEMDERMRDAAALEAPTDERDADSRGELPEPTARHADGTGFADLGLGAHLTATLATIGYEQPSPIQAATIPALLAGRDVLGQAQTGTGKTAAFALPVLDGLGADVTERATPHAPRALVLCPTRELAIQVAEAFQRYAAHLQGFHVLPIYGGQAYHHQLRPLERGVHVVVGTPGRVIDHLERGTLVLDEVRQIVLDEADEMLQMGFVEEVDRILERAPDERQILLFSATMPRQVQRLAETYLREPEVIRLETRTKVADTIRQRYLIVRGNLKLDALTRILETEPYDAMLIFARTKSDTVDLADKLEARGHACSPLNGDMPQRLREQTVERLKAGKLDLIVATDVAARGLDVERISHVLNYDLPTGIEPYTHRIGRTGRAGRKGEAILFVKPQERRLLRSIERATDAPLETYRVPADDEVNASRIARFKERVLETVRAEREDGTRELYKRIVVEILEGLEDDIEPEDVLAALAELAQGEQSLLFQSEGRQAGRERSDEERESWREQGFRHKHGRERRDERRGRGDDRGREGRFDRERGGAGRDRGQRDRRDVGPAGRDDRGFGRRDDRGYGRDDRSRGGRGFGRDDRGRGPGGDRGRFDKQGPPVPTDEPGMVRYRVEVGHEHGLRPGNLVGALANEGGVEGPAIGRIDIRDRFSTVDLPSGMPPEIYQRLQNARVRGQKLRLSEVRRGGGERGPKPGRGRYTKPDDRS